MCCKQVMTSNESKLSFIEVPVKDQLKNLLGHKYFYVASFPGPIPSYSTLHAENWDGLVSKITFRIIVHGLGS